MGVLGDDTGGRDAASQPDGHATVQASSETLVSEPITEVIATLADEPVTEVVTVPIEPAPAVREPATVGIAALIDLSDDLEVVDELPRPTTSSPPRLERRSSQSIPPPIPERRRRATTMSAGALAIAELANPTSGFEVAAAPKVVSDAPAVSVRTPVNYSARAEELAKDLEYVALVDSPGAASLAYELGELYERRLVDEERAVNMYRRAFALDMSLRPNRWALRRILYRRALWPDLVTLIDAEVSATTDDRERVDLLFERALVSAHCGSADDQARIALDDALRIAPLHQAVLLELERVVVRTGDVPALLDVWEHLAHAIEQPERKIAYWLEVARAAAERDHGRAVTAFDAAAQLAAAPRPALWRWPERVARERLRIADVHGTPAQVGAAIEALAQVLMSVGQPDEHPSRAIARRCEQVALRRRQAQLTRVERPLDAWAYLQQALALDPEEPVVLVDLIELAGELGRHDAVPGLVHAWHAVEDVAGRAGMLAFWCAEAHLDVDRRVPRRALLAALDASAAGFVLFTSSAECSALADPFRVPAQLELAGTYLAAADAAVLGSWLGPGAPAQPDPNAAVALYIQAADLLAYYVGTPAACKQARDALGKALAVAPGHPAVIEALTELDDTTGNVEDALARLRELATAASDDRVVVERAIRLARSHGLLDTVLELERELVTRAPDTLSLAWRLESTLFELGRDAERAELLGRLAREDTDPARRRTALFDAARLHERAGAAALATELYRQLLAEWPQDTFTRDALIDSLRAQQRWVELVSERRAEARTLEDGPAVRRALREAAWVLEVLLDDVAQAAEVYDEWLARLPDDRTALEGIARCRATRGDHAAEVTARAAIAELDQSPEARWLHARSLERAARYDQAAAQYRSVAAGDDSSVAVTSATLAIGDLAARGADIAMRIEAADALASRTTDPRLGGALFEDSGWMYAVALGEVEHAAKSFAAALALQPSRRGALLGAALVAACQPQPLRLGAAYVELASTVAMPEASAAWLLRAAAIAAASGDPELARERAEAARLAAPEDRNALLVTADLGPARTNDMPDLFADSDRQLARAELLELRGALTDDAAARMSWALDRAEVLELAGQLREASAVLAEVLLINPDDRRAVSAARRIAQRAGDPAMTAQASYALARLSRDPRFKLRLLRVAVAVYDRPGPSNNAAHALATYRRIVALEPVAPESERFLELLRERGDARNLIGALTDQMTRLAAAPQVDDTQMIPLLLERAMLLKGLDCHDKAMVDLDALLDHAPDEVDALRLRADLANRAGDVDGAIALWRRYLASEKPDLQRAEIEFLLERALKHAAAPAVAPAIAPAVGPAPTPTAPREKARWEQEPTAVGAIPQPLDASPSQGNSGKRRSPAIIRRTSGSMPAVSDPEPDPFGGTTVVADVRELQAAERREVRAAAIPVEEEYDLEITGDAARQAPKVAALPTLTVPIVRRAQTDPFADSFDDAFADALAEVLEGATAAAAIGPSAEPVPAAAPKPWPPALTLAELSPFSERTEVSIEVEPSLDAAAIQVSEDRQLSPDDSAVVMLSYNQLQSARPDQASEEALLQYEHEIALVDDDPASVVTLRIEAGRLCETLRATDRARAHYDAALVADPRATAALRGLRRIAHEHGELVEVIRLVEAELALAGARERDALVRYRIDLLMATGEHDRARVAVGEVIDRAPSDMPALLAHLELAFVDDRAADFGSSLELLAAAVTDPELRGAVQAARAVLAAHHGDTVAAATWFAAAAESDPESPATRLGAIRHAAAQGHGDAAGIALLDLARNVEGEDPITAAALAVRAQLWTAGSVASDVGARETLAVATELAARAAPRDPLVARIATETVLVAGDPRIAIHAFTRWARCKSAPVERAYAAARAAELEPALGRLWAQVLELDPGDDYAAARLRTAHVAAGEVALAIELDLKTAQDTQREPPLLRAASELIGQHHVAAAIDALVRGREQCPTSVAIAEALADALGAAGRWIDRAKLCGELAAEPGVAAGEVARLRSALAWEKAARAAATGVGEASGDELEGATVAALHAWSLVLDDDPRAPVAHAATIVLASRLEDRSILMKVLARAQVAERSPWAASSLALRHARLLLGNDPRRALELARAATPELDDPRRTFAVMMAAAARHELGEAVTVLEQRAAHLESSPASAAPSREPATLRLRAAQLALDADDVARAAELLARVDQALPGVVSDLIDATRRRAGESAHPRSGPNSDSFLRVLRDADLAAARGEDTLALERYQRALELRPADPLATAPLVRLATKLRAATPIEAIALDQVRSADAIKDPAAKAEAYELAARAEELRGDANATQLALESASQADPGRLDLMHRLERAHIVGGRYGELLQLREREIDQIKRVLGDTRPAPDGAHDLAAMTMDVTTLAVRAKRSDAELARLYRAALAADPRNRLARLHLEAIVRRAGFSEELAALEEQMASYFSDPRSQVAFLMRAGETLVGLGKPAEAVQRFARAAQVLPGHLPAVEAWHQTARDAELWTEVSAAEAHKARLAGPVPG